MLTFPSQDAPGGVEIDSAPHYAYDASLLFRQMELHQIDRTELADRDPLLFRELQALCTLCPSKQRCVLDNQAAVISERLRVHCPNAETLVALGNRADQKIFLPRKAGDARFGPQQYYYVSSKSGIVPHWWAEAARRIPQ